MGLLDVLQGASNAAASNVSGPVDMLAWALRKAGVPVPQNPVLGEQWMREKGLLATPQNKYAGAAGETLGLLGPIGAAAKAPQIAKGLLAAEDAGKRGAYAVGEKANDMAGNYMARSGMAPGVVGPQDKALRIAQENAAKPVSQGGLGLGPNNTAAERAAAMGFDTPAYHGTPDDRIVRSREFKNEMLGKSTRVSDAAKGHFTSDRGQVASEFIWRDGDTAGGNVLPLLLGGNRGKATIPGEWMPGKYDAALDAARAAGLDGLDIAGVSTLGKPGNYQVSFDPRNIRSRFAAFDPARRDTADILAGLAALGIGLPLLAGGERGRD